MKRSLPPFSAAIEPGSSLGPRRWWLVQQRHLDALIAGSRSGRCHKRRYSARLAEITQDGADLDSVWSRKALASSNLASSVTTRLTMAQPAIPLKEFDQEMAIT